MAALGTGADRSTLAWTGPLPEPVLDGRTITYPDVRPGVDLVFHAHATGYEQHVVVKDRAGAGAGARNCPCRCVPASSPPPPTAWAGWC